MNQTLNNLQSVDNDETQTLATLCKACADPLRLNILRVLSRDSFAVQELCQILDHKQSGLSHHLKILANAGWVNTRREGNTIFYRRAAITLLGPQQQLRQALLINIDGLPLTESTQHQLAAVKEQRAERSRAFFRQHSDQFSQQQEQIASFDVYASHAASMIELAASPTATILEVGPGEGNFLSALAPLFRKVYALDNSEAMLDKARRFAKDQQLHNVEFIHGDTQHPSLEALSIDVIAINMVLHHIASPSDIFVDLFQRLSENGHLYVTDLCKHEEAWVQDACGDLWQGFEPEELKNWAEAAGFIEGQSMYLTQLNGFRIQIREFIKPQ